MKPSPQRGQLVRRAANCAANWREFWRRPNCYSHKAFRRAPPIAPPIGGSFGGAPQPLLPYSFPSRAANCAANWREFWRRPNCYSHKAFRHAPPIAPPIGGCHSGLYGGAAPNPIHGLMELFGKCKDAAGSIRIPGMYDDVVPPGPVERESWRRLPFDESEFLHQEWGPKS